ncbi:ectoine synthase [uncultured Sneathiella sp.]|jgi:L-ectoine synthase|uniref:ectoine synthase n=1 Tax=uncultured Sneathiella sp. TaxID=879315 RepID=UPI0030DBA428|tara:strand:- start:195 stop:599 length:405 start_codon:yes stop_codon:yes gene_type:complete
MIVRTLKECENSNRTIKTDTWKSVRLSLADDGMGFSFHITTIYAGSETPIWYKNHFETVYCISGNGEVETVSDGKVYKIEPGTVYILNKNDQHILRGGTEDMQLACAFNPSLNGREVHDADGAYQLNEEALQDA